MLKFVYLAIPIKDWEPALNHFDHFAIEFEGFRVNIFYLTLSLFEVELIYIFSKTRIPKRPNPNLRVLAVTWHRSKRERRSLSSACKTGH
ncbi:hypothetical protein Syn7502_03047 [Synechococcus sp. PCC 7502]|nr:hypothetical protein Syn7502_03047 [Synechococcus sp. PCC 7502]